MDITIFENTLNMASEYLLRKAKEEAFPSKGHSILGISWQESERKLLLAAICYRIDFLNGELYAVMATNGSEDELMGVIGEIQELIEGWVNLQM
jgi:hypothetical protein